MDRNREEKQNDEHRFDRLNDKITNSTGARRTDQMNVG